jgi:mono/diheme cytochrome c family protein
MSAVARAVAVLCGLLVAGTGYLQLQAADPQAPPAAPARPVAQPPLARATLPPEPLNTLVDSYCVSCHNTRVKTAALALDEAARQTIAANPEIWEKVVRKLRGGAMPPVGRPRPSAAAVAGVVTSLETALDRAAAADPNPGRLVVHRLNRAEYGNAIRDLLGLDIDARALLPGDNSDQGFDNIADVLTVSPSLLDRYLSAARKISRLAVGRQTMKDSLTYQLGRSWYQDDRMSEALPFGSSGGVAIPYEFPVDGEYAVRIKLQTNIYDYIQGLGNPHDLDVRLDGARLERFTIGGPEHGVPPPVGYAGNIFGDARWEAYAREADANLEVRFPAKAGRRVVGVAFVKRSSAFTEGVRQPGQVGNSLAQNERIDGQPGVASVMISGPFVVSGSGDSASRRQIFVCRPTAASQEEACAKKILETLARRAYRRPVAAPEVGTLLDFYRAGRSEGSFDAGIQHALERLLCSPEFLFRIEQDQTGAAPSTTHRISDLDLASRLSFFLWSSIPDDELLDLAARGRLRDPSVLERQVRRMLADKRSAALVENFANQWLVVRNVREASPDPDLFPDFNENLREALLRETELFVQHIIREDRSVLELLTADYTFVNERLARHYDIPGVYGNHFRRVPLADPNRRGLLGHGSILMVTAYPNRTSPVLRGKWLLDNFLGSPPPPPPPTVDTALRDTGEDGQPATVRERLEQHRKNPACASCHAPMDPLGFALENFDPIGGWRTEDSGKPVDSSGSLPDGAVLDGPAGLQRFLLSRREEFLTTVTEKLLMYALGRKVEYYDGPAVRKVTRTAAADGHRWSSLVLGIVRSAPFQMRRSGS